MLHRIPFNQIKTLMVEYLKECEQFTDADELELIDNFDDLAKNIEKYWDLEMFFYVIGTY